ncbi:glycine-rich cell wall structural protein 1.8-like [Diachasma alloeum]|uniref:glycine-rich cell wall structural protein 1.8-like n=1 Tax=Diachasma alloeum TaxID=454923 RepID=UPI00073836DD|nr:glycine-rich cell wall structural protein 1.8-like [Diachasma alloeum]
MLRLLILGFLAGILMESCEAGGGHGGHDHVIIHVPYHIKTLKHTHTITKHIHHKSGGGDHYEVLGYTVGHPIDLGGHGGGHGFSGGHGGDWSGGNEIGGHHFEGEYGGGEEHGGY